jgi:hypothetical protein
MKLTSKIFWFIVIAVILYAGFFVYEKMQIKKNSAPESIANNPALQPDANLQIYTNKDYKFEISFPKDFSEDTTGQQPIEEGNIQYNFELSVIPPVAVFNLSPENYKNTGFKSAYFSVVEYTGVNNIPNCKDLLPASDNQNNRTNVIIDGREFYRYDWSDNAMGGQRGVGYVYFGSYNDKCIMMDGFLNYRDERGFVDNNPKYLTDSTIAEILNEFDNTAKTFKSI